MTGNFPEDGNEKNSLNFDLRQWFRWISGGDSARPTANDLGPPAPPKSSSAATETGSGKISPSIGDTPADVRCGTHRRENRPVATGEFYLRRLRLPKNVPKSSTTSPTPKPCSNA